MIEKVEFIARRAGEVIRQGFGKKFSIEFKTSESNLVTEIDKKAEKTIIDFISKEYKNHSILSEESGATNKNSEFLWVVDPLDGTTNFAHGLPIFSVSIGIQKNGETICGVIYDVMSDNMYSAVKGNGAYRNNQKIKVSTNSNLAQSLLVTGFPYDYSNNPGNTMKIFNEFLTSSRAVRRLGSAAIDMCYVASGIFDGFWESNLSPWDMAAGILLIEEAGGKVTNYQNEKTNIYTKQILATNEKVHSKMIKIIENNL